MKVAVQDACLLRGIVQNLFLPMEVHLKLTVNSIQ